jgi:hypothetical protein
MSEDILVSSNEINKIVYYKDSKTGNMMARVFGKTEGGAWYEMGNIHVDQLVWNFAYDNHLVG